MKKIKQVIFLYTGIAEKKLGHQRKRFVFVVYFKMAIQRDKSKSFCTSSCGTQTEWGRKPWGVSYKRLCDQEAHGRWQRCQQTCRQLSNGYCGSWQLAGCHSRDSLRDAIRGTIVLRPLPTRLLTPSPSFMRFLIA